VPLRIPNAIDLHCHFGPDTTSGTLAPPRHQACVSALDAAREAAETGHAALVLKSHSFASPVLAQNLQQAVPGVRVFGGICTDYLSGGLNVDGVSAALAMGARIVWLPTMHSRSDFERARDRTSHPGPIAVVDDTDSSVVPEVHEIFALVQETDSVLATGHTTAAEHYAVVKEFASRGKVIVTHAGEPLAGPVLTPQQCTELADLGAFIEVTAQMCKPIYGHPGTPIPEIIDMIQTVGTSRVCLSTDYGWTTEMPHPAAGLQEFLEALWSEGMAEQELELMVSKNPGRLLGLSF
jgi:hypothetical protein